MNRRRAMAGTPTPLNNMLNPGLSVECNVIHVHPKYIIVDPVREPIPINDTINSIKVEASLLEDLESLVDFEDRHNSTAARALLCIIEKIKGNA